MRRSEYFETREGQISAKSKRSLNKIYFQINQEPKSKKAISLSEKKQFRREIAKHLKAIKRRPFKGNIILEIDFYTTQNNPPAIHTLAKNYLDLLHKPMPDVDNYEKILFDDDSQVKTLIANYNLNLFGNAYPQIHITAYRHSYFLKDIELADRIRNNKFNNLPFDAGYNRHSEQYQDIRNIEKHERALYNNDLEDLLDLEKEKEFYIKNFSEEFYKLKKVHLIRNIQEHYLRLSNLSLNDLISIYQHTFSYNKIYATDERFQQLWEISRNLVSVSTNLIELGGSPTAKGDHALFRTNLEKKT
jgi:hypothetical protein